MEKAKKVTILSAQQEHLSAIVEIEHICFTEPWSETLMRFELEHPDSLFFVAQNDEIICGYITLRIICGEVHVMSISVLPDFQNQGIGSALLGFAIEQAEQLGYHLFTLEVRKSNLPAILLYTRYGFEAEGVRPRYYEDGEDAIIMWKKSHQDSV